MLHKTKNETKGQHLNFLNLVPEIKDCEGFLLDSLLIFDVPLPNENRGSGMGKEGRAIFMSNAFMLI